MALMIKLPILTFKEQLRIKDNLEISRKWQELKVINTQNVFFFGEDIWRRLKAWMFWVYLTYIWPCCASRRTNESSVAKIQSVQNKGPQFESFTPHVFSGHTLSQDLRRWRTHWILILNSRILRAFFYVDRAHRAIRCLHIQVADIASLKQNNPSTIAVMWGIKW